MVTSGWERLGGWAMKNEEPSSITRTASAERQQPRCELPDAIRPLEQRDDSHTARKVYAHREGRKHLTHAARVPPTVASPSPSSSSSSSTSSSSRSQRAAGGCMRLAPRWSAFTRGARGRGAVVRSQTARKKHGFSVDVGSGRRKHARDWSRFRTHAFERRRSAI
jgi:hypothetical protein